MSTDIPIPHGDITFPDCCPVCLQQATEPVTLQKTVMLWIASQYVRQQVRYCPTHAQQMHHATAPARILHQVGSAAIIVGCAAFFVSVAVSTGLRGLVRLIGVVLLSGVASAWLIGHYTRLLAALRDLLIHPKYRATYNALRIASFRIQGDRLHSITFRAENLAYAVKLAAANDIQLEAL